MYAMLASSPVSVAAPAAAPVVFTILEHRVLRLAASGSEKPSTSVEPGLRRLGRHIADIVLSRRGGRNLADPRLEALRSYGASVRLGQTDGLALLYAAGYTQGHAAEIKRIVAHEVRAARHRTPRRDSVVYAGGLSLGVASLTAFVAMTGTLLAGY